MPIIHTYFDVTYPLPDQGEVIRCWRDSWARRGWDPIILNPRTYAGRPDRREFTALAEELSDDPTHYYRMMRLLALAEVGGGWLCDYDVINFDFRPVASDATERSRFFDCDYALSYITEAHARHLVSFFLGEPTGDLDTLYAALAPTVYDNVGNTCVRYGTWRWEKAPAVHFGAMDVQLMHGRGVKKHRAIDACGRSI